MFFVQTFGGAGGEEIEDDPLFDDAGRLYKIIGVGLSLCDVGIIRPQTAFRTEQDILVYEPIGEMMIKDNWDSVNKMV